MATTKPIFKKEMSFDKFKEAFSEENRIFMREARLIPFSNDEMALTSIFLSSLRLIKEFRKLVSNDIGISSAGNIHVFTEVSFDVENPDKLKKDSTKRIDGMIVVERANKVKDVVLLEVKNKNNELDEKQIEGYIEIAKEHKIKKLVTITNQFVANPQQTLLNIKIPKNIEIYHLSWSYILTLANILLFDNDLNISDEDQVEIMKEVVKYLEDDKSGVAGFTQMKEGWKNVAENIPKAVKSSERETHEAVESWLQEEKDIALVLSREIGSLVQTGVRKFKNDLQERIKYEKINLVEKKRLESSFIIKNAVAPIDVEANFENKNVEMRVTIQADENYATPQGQIGWLKKMFKKCESDSKKEKEDKFVSLNEKIFIEAKYKNRKKVNQPRHSLCKVDEFANKEIYSKTDTISKFTVIYINSLGSRFKSRKKFVQEIEKMIVDFYGAIVQNLKNGEKKVPVVKDEK